MKSKMKSINRTIRKDALILHPALDIQENVLVLGFEDKEYNQHEEKSESFNRYLLAIHEEGRISPRIVTTQGVNHVNDGDKLYIFDAVRDEKKRHLVAINSRWSKKYFDTLKTDIEKVDPSHIYKVILDNLKKYLELEKEEDYHIITSWCIGTYFFPIFKAYPYLHIKGMKGSGKTTALDFLKLTAHNSFKERSTMPSFRDNVDSQRGVALIDQADKRFGTQSEDDMIDVMVDSYKASSGIMSKMTMVKKNHVRVEYNAYVPKAFASIKELNFDLKDRCIQIQFIKSLSNKNQLNSDDPIWASIRHSLYCLLINNFMNIPLFLNEVEESIKNDERVVGRNAELWKPIETMMRFCKQPEEIVNNVRRVYIAKTNFTQDGVSPLEASLIEYIDKHLEGKVSDWISVKDIVNQLILTEDDEWEEMKLRSKGQLVGNLISRINLHSAKKHTKGGNYYLFEKDKLLKIKRAYLNENEPDLSPVFTTPEINITTEPF